MNRKRLNNITMALVTCCLFVSGCGKQLTAAQGETTDIFSSYTISESGILKDNGMHYLLFYDKESDNTVYFCNRAGCRHIDYNCGAYFENMYEAFFYNDDLYVITTSGVDTQIFRADRYGENRELLANISYPVLQTEIVGNELYFFGVIWGEERNNTRSSVDQAVCRLNLNTGDYEIIPNQDTGYPNASPGHFTVTNDFIYICYTASSIDINDFFDPDTAALRDVVWDEIVYTDLVYRMNQNTKETELIYTREKTGGSFGVSVLEEREHSLVLFFPSQIIEYDLHTGEETVLYLPADEITQIGKIADHYIIYSYLDSQYVLLENWQETASFSGSDYGLESYAGISGDTVYFMGNNGLYAIKYNDLINRAYDFQFIDF